MKKVILFMLAAVLGLSLSACGMFIKSNFPSVSLKTEQAVSADSGKKSETEKNDTEAAAKENTSESTKEADEARESTAAESPAAEEASEDTMQAEDETPESTEEAEETPDYTFRPASQDMLELSNTNLQGDQNQMAFDAEYIYFVDDRDSYRCRYDGSDVQKLERGMYFSTAADGKLWGYYGRSDMTTHEAGLYVMDLQTLEITRDLELDDHESSGTILISGNWLCYMAHDDRGIVIRDLRTGEEKEISHPASPGEKVKVAEMCIYGNTLYAIVGSTIANEMKYQYALCSYNLGSDAETMTDLLAEDYTWERKASIWMEDGILLLDKTEGIQYYYAKFEEIGEDGSWEFRKEENKVGTDMASDAANGIGDEVGFAFNASYILGNDLLLIMDDGIQYFEGFDFTANRILWAGDIGTQPYRASHGMHEGSVYLYLEGTDSSGAEILKFTEGGAVEHIPITLP